MIFSDFLFLLQAPPEMQFFTIVGILAEFAVMLIVGFIVEYIKPKKKRIGTVAN